MACVLVATAGCVLAEEAEGALRQHIQVEPLVALQVQLRALDPAHDTARGCHQYVCHEDCIIIKEIRIKLELLRKFLAEALDAAGYTEMYHEALKDLKRKYQGRPLDVDRAKRGCMKHNLRKA